MKSTASGAITDTFARAHLRAAFIVRT
jgi:hypothetical protein